METHTVSLTGRFHTGFEGKRGSSLRISSKSDITIGLPKHLTKWCYHRRYIENQTAQIRKDSEHRNFERQATSAGY